MDADEYYEINVSTDYSIETFVRFNTEQLGILEVDDMIVSFNINPIGIDICKRSDGLYESFVYYMDGTGDYIPTEVTYTLEEIHRLIN